MFVPNALRQLSDCRILEQTLQSHFDAKHFSHVGNQLHGQQRMAAKIEEIVVDTLDMPSENLLPYLNQACLDLVARGGDSDTIRDLTFGKTRQG